METQIVFWDVQHGNAAYIKTPNGRHLVIDLGSGSYSGEHSFSPLLHLKNKYRIAQLDCVIMTHPHLDHISDIMNFDHLFPKMIYCNEDLTRADIMKSVSENDRPIFEKYMEIINKYNTPAMGYNTFDVNNWGGLSINIFQSKKCSKENINNFSLVIILEYLGMKIVFTGDNEKCSLDELMSEISFIYATKDADILLAPHHGRESGFHNDFVKNVNPKITIISDGRFCDTSATNRYCGLCRGEYIYRQKSAQFERRMCLTTRNDGAILLKVGQNYNGNYLNCYID